MLLCSFALYMDETAAKHTMLSFDVKLNAKPRLTQSQRQMVGLTSKYITLFIVASLSSGILLALFEWYPYGSVVGITIDQCINILCLYLQYPFATESYGKYCKWIDQCCRGIISKAIRRAIADKQTQGDHTYPMDGHEVDGLHTCSVPSTSSGPMNPSGAISMIELSPRNTAYTNPSENLDEPPSDSEFAE